MKEILKEFKDWQDVEKVGEKFGKRKVRKIVEELSKRGEIEFKFKDEGKFLKRMARLKPF